MSTDLILYETRGPVAVITLNRPAKLNAINSPMVDGLNAAMDRAEADDSVRAILLKGAGKAFSAGFDLQGDTDAGQDWSDPGFLRTELTRYLDVILRFWDSPKPTISAVHKYCFGSAMEMAVACDITISSEDCRFGAPEVQFGSGIVAMILPWLAGPKAAKEMLLTGTDQVTAARAEAIGLVNHVVTKEALDDKAMEIALTLSTGDAHAITLTKQAINKAYDIMGFRDALLQALEIDVLIESTETEESKAFNAIMADKGPKAAIAWRRARINQTHG